MHPSCDTSTESAQSRPELPRSQQLSGRSQQCQTAAHTKSRAVLPSPQPELKNYGRINPNHVSIIIFFAGTHGLVVPFFLHEVTPNTLSIVPVSYRQVRLNPVRLNSEHSQTLLDEFSEVGSCSTSLSGMQSSPGSCGARKSLGRKGRCVESPLKSDGKSHGLQGEHQRASRGSQLPLVVKPCLGQGVGGAGMESKGRAGVWLLFPSCLIADASRVAMEIAQSPRLALSPLPGFGVQRRRRHLPPAWPSLTAPGPLCLDFPLFSPNKPQKSCLAAPRELCSLWRHFSALLRDVFKAPLFLFIVGSWKPFPGRASALCAWDRGELSFSVVPALRVQVLQNGRYRTCKLHFNVTATLDHI